jgi:hypothetical protein
MIFGGIFWKYVMERLSEKRDVRDLRGMPR